MIESGRCIRCIKVEREYEVLGRALVIQCAASVYLLLGRVWLVRDARNFDRVVRISRLNQYRCYIVESLSKTRDQEHGE